MLIQQVKITASVISKSDYENLTENESVIQFFEFKSKSFAKMVLNQHLFSKFWKLDNARRLDLHEIIIEVFHWNLSLNVVASYMQCLFFTLYFSSHIAKIAYNICSCFFFCNFWFHILSKV